MSEPLILVFEDDNPLHSIIRDKYTRQPRYNVITLESRLPNDTTVLYAVCLESELVPVAKIEWAQTRDGRDSTMVTFAERTLYLEHFMPKVHKLFGKSYWKFKAPNQRFYTWRVEDNSSTLIEEATHAYVARRQPESLRLSSGGALSLSVGGIGAQMLDTVLLTFILVEQLNGRSIARPLTSYANLETMNGNASLYAIAAANATAIAGASQSPPPYSGPTC